MSDLHDSTILVVGGTSGIGLATALEASRRGAHVHVAGRGADMVQRSAPDAAVTAHEMDLTESDEVGSVLAATGTLDHLVITAGAGRYGPVRDLTPEDAATFLNIKFWGQYTVVRNAIDHLTAHSSIVLLSGISSRHPAPGMSVMSATNAAVEAFGRALALELAPIRVNVVAPGLTRTPIYAGMPEQDREGMYAQWSASVAVGRPGRPEEVADAVLYLLSNDFITGVVLDVDGGGALA